MEEPLRADALVHRGDGGQVDQLALRDRARRGSEMSDGVARSSGAHLHHHVVQLVVPGKGADAAASQHGLERGADIRYGDADVLGAVPVVADRQFGLVHLQVRLDVDQPLDLAGARQEGGHDGGERVEVGVLHHELHRASEAADRRGRKGERLHARNAEELRHDAADDLLGAPRPVAPVLHVDEDEAAADVAAEADDAEVRVDFRAHRPSPFDLLLVAVGVLDGRALRSGGGRP